MDEATFNIHQITTELVSCQKSLREAQQHLQKVYDALTDTDEVPFTLPEEEVEDEPQDEGPTFDPEGWVRAVIEETLGDAAPSLSGHELKRIWKAGKEDGDRIRAAVKVLADKMEHTRVHSPVGLLITLCSAHNILQQAAAIENKSDEQKFSEATRAAKKKMDEKVRSRRLRGQPNNTTRAGNFRKLAEGVSAKGGAE